MLTTVNLYLYLYLVTLTAAVSLSACLPGKTGSQVAVAVGWY